MRIRTVVSTVRDRPRKGRIALIAAAAATVVVAGTTAVNAWTLSNSPPASYTFFSNTDTSPAVLDPDTQPVELGLRWRSSVDGTIDAVRFLKAPGDNSPHRVSVWSSGGRRLASTMSTGESASGWQQVKLPKPVNVRANRTYVVSYHTARYLATTGYFAKSLKSGPLTTPEGPNGVYAYGSGSFPTDSYIGSNYWVDLLFTTTAGPSPSPTGPTATANPTVTQQPPSASPSPTATQSRPGGGGALTLPRVPWEGGPAYYDQYASTKAWTNPNFFPVGVWFESVLSKDDTARDKAAGLNTYVELTNNSNAALVREAGMWAMPSGLNGAGSETVAHLLTDEPDMMFGPGWDGWSGRYGWNTCTPIQDQGGKCGYTVMKTLADRAPKDGKPRYANYGKGVMMWESDNEAQVFVNQFQQIVSADMYFYTDNNLCGGESERFMKIPTQMCRRSSSYGVVLDRMRKLDAMDGKRQPVWAFVEVGHPFTENHWPSINGNQIAGAVMNSLIHEARGVIYFNHNFGGSCQSQHVLRDSCGAAIRPAVTEVNRRVAALAPVLNSQSYQYSLNSSLDTMLKAHNGSLYVFAMPGRAGGTGTQTLTLPPGVNASQAEVMFENRTVPISGGQFTDSFPNEFNYHIYKITL